MDAEIINAQLSEQVSFNGNLPAENFVQADPDWRALLEKAVSNHPKGKAGVALRLKVCRSYVSRVLSAADGKWALKHVPDKFIARVLQCFHVVQCPAQGIDVSYDACARANGPVPTHNPMAVSLWRKCQTCPNKPAKESL